MCCAPRMPQWRNHSWMWCGQMQHNGPVRYFRLSMTASPSKPPPAPSTSRVKRLLTTEIPSKRSERAVYFYRPRKLSPPGRLTQKPPRELSVTGPILVEVDAPEPERLSQEFLPIFLRLRKVSPI